MDDDNTASATNSFSADNSQEQSADLNSKDVTQWSSAEVQHWVEEQCQKFELKKATTEKFQMNGIIDTYYITECLRFI
jgi:glutamyl/glutaminyl-tRNA synthetase